METSFLSKVQELVVEEALSGARVTEQGLAQQLGVSRTPVREALGSLEEQGILERRKYHGIRLRKPSLRDMIEIYDLRTALEGVAARILAVNIDQNELEELTALAKQCDQLTESRPDNDPENQRIDLQFHHRIVDKCGNRHLKKVFDTFKVLDISFRLYNIKPAKMERFKYTHQTIVDALKSRNPDKAEKIMRLHLQESKDFIIKIYLGPNYPLSEE